jgi:hypothetical protein
MKRLLTTSLAAAVLAATFIAGATPSASATGKATSNHTKSGGQTDKRLAAEKRQVVSLVATKDATLVRAIRITHRADLAIGNTEVLANIDADRLTLAGLRAAAQAATTVTDVRLVRAQVHAVRPEIYSVVVNGLRQAAHFQSLVAENADSITALGLTTDAKELEAFDVAAVRDALAAASLANDEAATLAAAALEKGVLLTASSTTVEREAFSSDVTGAGAALDVVEARLQLAQDTLANMVLAGESVVQEPLA